MYGCIDDNKFKVSISKILCCTKPSSVSRRRSRRLKYIPTFEIRRRRKGREGGEEKSGLLQGHEVVREGHEKECNSYLEFKMR